jgi:hypothetical protein
VGLRSYITRSKIPRRCLLAFQTSVDGLPWLVSTRRAGTTNSPTGQSYAILLFGGLIVFLLRGGPVAGAWLAWGHPKLAIEGLFKSLNQRVFRSSAVLVERHGEWEVEAFLRRNGRTRLCGRRNPASQYIC